MKALPRTGQDCGSLRQDREAAICLRAAVAGFPDHSDAGGSRLHCRNQPWPFLIERTPIDLCSVASPVHVACRSGRRSRGASRFLFRRTITVFYAIPNSQGFQGQSYKPAKIKATKIALPIQDVFMAYVCSSLDYFSTKRAHIADHTGANSR